MKVGNLPPHSLSSPTLFTPENKNENKKVRETFSHQSKSLLSFSISFSLSHTVLCFVFCITHTVAGYWFHIGYSANDFTLISYEFLISGTKSSLEIAGNISPIISPLFQSFESQHTGAEIIFHLTLNFLCKENKACVWFGIVCFKFVSLLRTC